MLLPCTARYTVLRWKNRTNFPHIYATFIYYYLSFFFFPAGEAVFPEVYFFMYRQCDLEKTVVWGWTNRGEKSYTWESNNRVSAECDILFCVLVYARVCVFFASLFFSIAFGSFCWVYFSVCFSAQLCRTSRSRNGVFLNDDNYRDAFLFGDSIFIRVNRSRTITFFKLEIKYISFQNQKLRVKIGENSQRIHLRTNRNERFGRINQKKNIKVS